MAPDPRKPARPARSLAGTLATTLAATTVSALPVLLLGGLAVLVRSDLAFGELGLGVAIGSFFTASALASLPAGAVSDRVGPLRAMAIGIGISIVSLGGIAAFPTSLVTMLPWLLAAGSANALIQVGANHLLAVEVPVRRQGLAYGVKQSAIPLAAVLAGLAVPAIGLTVGWRVAYGVAAGLGLLVGAAFWRRANGGGGHERRAGGREGDAPMVALVVLGVGAALGTTASNALSGFSVSSSVASGLPQELAGVLLTVGSLLGMSARIGSGWFADRRTGGSLLFVVVLLLTGSAGYAALALVGDSAPLVIAATVVAFLGGWGYQGLILLAVARTNREAPAAAMAIVRIGPNTGAMLGPLAFGFIVEQAGYSAAWGAAAAASLVGAALVLAGRVLLLPTRRRIVAEREEEVAPR